MASVHSDESVSEIQQFYNGKSIFVTGGTGFVGKFIIEKLLRSCSGLKNIYVLVRQKKGKDIHKRIEDIFESSLFERLKNEFPNFKEKIVLIAGELTEPKLGMSSEDIKTLKDNVNVILHAAATVKFDEELKKAMAINTQGPLEILEMAKGFKNLEALVHISTAYSNCPQPVIDEKIYDSEIDYFTLKESVDKLTDEKLAEILPTILGEWPNTYTFTKAMTERELTKRRGSVPLAFFRPAIVASSYKEPVPAWVDNLTACTGLAVGGGSGVLHVAVCEADNDCDLVPVDYVVNALIAASYNVYTTYKQAIPDEPLVFNYVSSVEKPIKNIDFFSRNFPGIEIYPFPNQIWYTSLIMTSNRSLAKFLGYILHIIPAKIMDFFAALRGSDQRYEKIYKKIESLADLLSYFMSTPFVFYNKKVQGLWQSLSEDDKKIFPFSFTDTFEWDDYFKLYCLGIRRYYFKESDDTLPRDRKRSLRFKYLHYTIKYLFQAVVLYLLWAVIRVVLSIFV